MTGLLIVIFCTLCLPYRYSSKALQARRSRAVKGGRLQPSEEDPIVRQALRFVRKSRVLHAMHDRLSDQPHYHARLPTAVVSDVIGLRRAREVHKTHKLACKAKHLVGARAVADTPSRQDDRFKHVLNSASLISEPANLFTLHSQAFNRFRLVPDACLPVHIVQVIRMTSRHWILQLLFGCCRIQMSETVKSKFDYHSMIEDDFSGHQQESGDQLKEILANASLERFDLGKPKHQDNITDARHTQIWNDAFDTTLIKNFTVQTYIDRLKKNKEPLGLQSWSDHDFVLVAVVMAQDPTPEFTNELRRVLVDD